MIVSYKDSDGDGVADNPDFFDEVVAPLVDPNTKLVFFELLTDFDDLERYLPVEPGLVNASFANLNAIEVVKNEFVNGQIFYTTTTKLFYKLEITTISGIIQRTLIPQTTYIARTGRGNLAFQYRHNSPLTNVIDPGTSNIIDLYLVTQTYYNGYQNYIRDTTGTVPEHLQIYAGLSKLFEHSTQWPAIAK